MYGWLAWCVAWWTTWHTVIMLKHSSSPHVDMSAHVMTWQEENDRIRCCWDCVRKSPVDSCYRLCVVFPVCDCLSTSQLTVLVSYAEPLQFAVSCAVWAIPAWGLPPACIHERHCEWTMCVRGGAYVCREFLWHGFSVSSARNVSSDWSRAL